MKNNLEFDFSVDREKKTITVKREYAAGVTLVWDAHTKSELLDQWWAPKPWKASTDSMDFSNGGSWKYAMVGPEGEEHHAIAEFSNIRPQQGYTASDAFVNADGSINTDLPQATWDMTFSPKGDNTLVQTVIQYNSEEDIEVILQMGFKEGLSMGMDQLDELLPTLKK